MLDSWPAGRSPTETERGLAPSHGGAGIATADQDQRSNTEKQRKLAEDARLAAEVSRAAADNAYRNAMNLTPEQFLRLETIHMQERVCARGGCTFISGQAVPMVGVK